MKAGVAHLQDKLEAVRDELGGKKIELHDESVAEVLRECEHVINNVLRRIKAGEAELKRAKMTGSLSATSLAASGSVASIGSYDDDLNLSASRPYNQRIELSYGDDNDDDYFADEPAVLVDVDDDELTRDKVKRASMSILQAVDKKRRKPKKKGAAGGGGSSSAAAGRGDDSPKRP